VNSLRAFRTDGGATDRSGCWTDGDFAPAIVSKRYAVRKDLSRYASANASKRRFSTKRTGKSFDTFWPARCLLAPSRDHRVHSPSARRLPAVSSTSTGSGHGIDFRSRRDPKQRFCKCLVHLLVGCHADWFGRFGLTLEHVPAS
jgi:hypothetical protein